MKPSGICLYGAGVAFFATCVMQFINGDTSLLAAAFVLYILSLAFKELEEIVKGVKE